MSSKSTERALKPSPIPALWDETIVREPYQASEVSTREGVLRVVSGPHSGVYVDVGATRVHVGRADWCDISLAQDALVSRHHCELVPHPEGLEVRDLGSRNGIYLEGSRVYHALLVPGKTLLVGDSTLSLDVGQASIQIPIPYHDKSKRLVGRSEKMQELFSLVAHIAPYSLPVLLLGETGTGKTSCALSIHEQSQRAAGPFVHVNCGALSPTLIESALFGYEKGAFTHAHKRHKGLFEQANGGTLFLDEIGELPLELQPKLLDVIERKKLRRLGAEEETSVDFRLIAATHRNLRKAAYEGTFREDLLYRIAVAELSIPALREHLDDVPLLVDYLLFEMDAPPDAFLTEAAIEKCRNYLWPGNVRQLRNTLERGLLFSKGGKVESPHIQLPPLPTECSTTPPSQDAPPLTHKEPPLPRADAPLQEQLEALEKQLLTDALARYHWNTKMVQEQLQISRSWFYSLLKKHGLQRP